MQLFLDIDGVLLNFEHAFVRFLNRDRSLSLPLDYEAEHWDFVEVMERNKLEETWMRFVASDEVAKMPPLVAPRDFNALTGDHEVHLLTNFPLPHMDKRHRNLAAHGFRFESLHYCGLHPYKELRPRTKAQLIAELRKPEQQALFVDDHPDNCLDVHQNCPEVEVWVMSRRFNRDFAHPGIPRAHDWDCLFNRLAGSIAPPLSTSVSAAF